MLVYQAIEKGKALSKARCYGKKRANPTYLFMEDEIRNEKENSRSGLAGTTAFSVFGAVLSASAAASTHTAVDNDAYVSYSSVAKTIKARAEKVERSAPDVIIIDSKESNSLARCSPTPPLKATLSALTAL